MQPNLVRKFKTLGLICIFTCFAGVIFQLIAEERLDYNSVSIGFVFGLLELFLFPKAEMRFRQWSFTKILLFKTLLYTAVIYVVTVALATIGGLFQGRKLSELPAFLVSEGELVLVVYTLVIYSLLVFFLQINQLLLSIRFYDTRHSSNNVDRALTSAELADAKLAGTRGYTYIGKSDPPAIQITVPGSAPYNWYKKP
jgi:hypothetical protein